MSLLQYWKYYDWCAQGNVPSFCVEHVTILLILHLTSSDVVVRLFWELDYKFYEISLMHVQLDYRCCSDLYLSSWWKTGKDYIKIGNNMQCIISNFNVIFTNQYNFEIYFSVCEELKLRSFTTPSLHPMGDLRGD